LVGEIAQRRAARTLHLGDEHVAVLVFPREVRAFDGVRLPCLLAKQVGLAPELVRLARPLAQPGERLARRQRLDAPGAGAHRTLGEDREGADLGSRPDVRSAAELA